MRPPGQQGALSCRAAACSGGGAAPGGGRRAGGGLGLRGGAQARRFFTLFPRQVAAATSSVRDDPVEHSSSPRLRDPAPLSKSQPAADGERELRGVVRCGVG